MSFFELITEIIDNMCCGHSTCCKKKYTDHDEDEDEFIISESESESETDFSKFISGRMSFKFEGEDEQNKEHEHENKGTKNCNCLPCVWYGRKYLSGMRFVSPKTNILKFSF